ncbi:MAG: endonuclease/exonuclease/phosphatase family protein [Candidatus Microsaccharimonas sp.]
MKLTTLNLQGFDNWETREPAITEYLRRVDSDVVLFQEVVYLPIIALYNQVQILNQTLNYPHVHSSVTRLQPSEHHETYREGLAALSKHPVIETDTIVLKKAPGDEHDRIVQLLDVSMGESVLKIVNVHFSLTDTIDYATAHLQETLGILAARGEERIIAGDFNINHLEDLSDIWKEGYRSSTDKNYVSFPAMNKRVDYVLIPKSNSFLDISTSTDELSDHRAVTVDIQIA